jgi:hypothetical protein
MTVRDTSQAERIESMIELKRRAARSRERATLIRLGAADSYERGRTDMAAEILREIQAGRF